MEKIGIDVHKVATQVCILTDTGEYEEHRIRTERDALTKLFGARTGARIVLEAATESEWVARHLESLGHEVIVADPNFAPMYASRSRKVKTDKRDARALCEACHLGAYRATHRASDCSRLARKSLAVREVLVQTRSRMISLCRALLRQEGVRVPTGGAPSFANAYAHLLWPKSSHRRCSLCLRLTSMSANRLMRWTRTSKEPSRSTSVLSVSPRFRVWGQ